MAAYDGEIRIGTKFDLEGIEAAEQESASAGSSIGKSLDKGFEEGKKSAQGFGSVAKTVASGVKKAFEAAIGVITAAASAVAGVAAVGIKYNSEMEDYLTNFSVLLGGVEEAEKHVGNLREMAASTPYQLGDLASVTQMLIQYGQSAEEAEESLRFLGDIAQGSSQKMQSIGLAYAQMSAQGKVSMQDVKQMINAGFNPLAAVAKMTGESLAEVTARQEDGKLTVQEITAAMKAATEEGGQFYQSMEKASQTMSGQLSTLKDNARGLAGQMAEGLSSEITTKLLPSINEAINEISASFEKGGFDAASLTAGAFVARFIADMAKQAPRVIKTGVKVLEAVLKGLTENAGEIADACVEIATEFAHGIGAILPKIYEAGKTVLVEFTRALLGKELAGKLQQTIGKVEQAFRTIWDALSPVIESLSGSLTPVLDLVLNLLGSAADMVTYFSPLINTLAGILKIAADVVGWLAEGLAKLTSNGVAAQGMAVALFGTWGAGAVALNEFLRLMTETEHSTHAITDEQAELINSTKDLIAAQDERHQKAADLAEDRQTEINGAADLWAELQKCTDENGNILQGYEERAEFIAGELSAALGIEIGIVDGQITKYGELKQSIDQVIAAKRLEITLDAYKEDYIATLNEQNELQERYTQIASDAAAAEEEWNEIKEDAYLVQQSLADGTSDYIRILAKYNGSQYELQMALADAEAKSNDLHFAQEQLGDQIAENEIFINNYESALGATTGTVDEMTAAQYALRHGMKTATTATREELQNQLTEYAKKYEEMREAVANGSTDITQTQVNEMAAMVQAAKSELDKYDQMFGEAMDKTVETVNMVDYESPIRDQIDDTAAAAADLAKAVESNLGSVDAYTSGQNTAQGYIDGMESKKAAVASAAYAIGAVSVDNLNKATRQHSPSRATRESGVNFDLGYIGGMESLRTKVERMARSIGAASLSGLNSINPTRALPPVPHLASGAVIPPNAPYLAVVGDQKSGTNVETPLDTIKQAVAEVMGSGNGSPNIIRVYLSGRQIYEAVLDEDRREQISTGQSGFATA